MQSAMQDRPRFTPEDQILARAGASPPRNQLRDEFRHAGVSWPGGTDQIRGVAKDVVRDHYLPHHLLQLENLRAVQQGLKLRSLSTGRPLHDLQLLAAVGVTHDDIEHEAVEL